MPAETYDEWLESRRELQRGSRPHLDRRLECVRLASRHPCDAIVHPASRRVVGVQIVATGEFVDRALFGAMAEAILAHGHLLDVRDAFRLALEWEHNAAPAAGK